MADEVAFWQSEDSASPDIEVINAIKPGMSSIPGSLLLAISSPYARRGALWRAYKNHYGKDGDSVLIWQAPTVAMNPTVDARFIADAYEEDEASASAEYGAQFRRDIESFVSIEVVEGCTVAGRTHLPPDANVEYYGFVDPSGGARDSFCLAIGHRTDEMVVVDMLAERRAPLSPESVVGEFAGFLNQYRISSVVGDKYAGGWPREQFQKHGIGYDASAAPKSDLYKDLLPILNSGKIELLDNKRLINQLVGLERRTSRSGKDSIDHGRGVTTT